MFTRGHIYVLFFSGSVIADNLLPLTSSEPPSDYESSVEDPPSSDDTPQRNKTMDQTRPNFVGETRRCVQLFFALTVTGHFCEVLSKDDDYVFHCDYNCFFIAGTC